MKKLFLCLTLSVLLSGCSTNSEGQINGDDFLKAYGEVTDSMTSYILLKPTELNLTYEESMMAIDSALARMRTAQMVFQKMTQDRTITLTDGTISKESVNSLNSAFDEFISSQEVARDQLEYCEKFSDPYEALDCVLQVQIETKEITNAKYQNFYQANEKFKQDATN